MRRLALTTAGLALLVSASAYAAPARIYRTGAPQGANWGKLDSHMQALETARLRSRPPTADERSGLTLSPRGEVLVDVYLNGDIGSARSELEALGMRVQAVSTRQPERMVEGWLAPDDATKAAALGSVHAVLAVMGGGTNTGSVLSEGDAAHNGPAARALGTTGAGVTVGVISDSINQASGGIASSGNNLPADTTALADAVGGSDEGRAMSEIIYDEAPGITKIRFSTGVGGPAGKAASISNLVAAGARVIADDTFYLTEPMFQDGIVAQAVDSAKAAGVAYLTSAGNRARQSWEGRFTPGTGDFNNFNPGGAEDLAQTLVSVPAGFSLLVALQWAEPFGGATTDLDLGIFDVSDLNNPVGSPGVSDNLASGIPAEFASWTNPGASARTVAVEIARFAGSGTPLLKYVVANDFGPFNVAEHATNSPTIDPDAASANGALTIAAVAFNDAGLNTPEPFSSRGPATRLFTATGAPLASPDVRAKPDLAAADGVSTSLADFDPFFGTSAAAPSAAGIAVLMRSIKPSMTVNEVYAILRNVANANDCTSAVGAPDFDCGSGFVLADRAVTQSLDSTPPSVTPNVSSGATQANGFFHGDVTVSFALADAESPVGDATGCATTVINRDAIVPFTCTAGSAGGTTTQSLTVKRDASPPILSIGGIAAKSYTPLNLPKLSAVHCNATDPTSGITSCALSGFGKGRGSHKLTAKATDGAALSSTKSLTYKVAPIAGISIAKSIKLSKLISSGLPVALNVDKGTTLGITITATNTAAAGAARSTVVGTFRKKIKKGGKVKVRVKLNRSGRTKLSHAKRATLRVKITGNSKSAGKTTTTQTVKAK